MAYEATVMNLLKNNPRQIKQIANAHNKPIELCNYNLNIKKIIYIDKLKFIRMIRYYQDCPRTRAVARRPVSKA